VRFRTDPSRHQRDVPIKEHKMKKLLAISSFALAVSIASSFGTGSLEIRTVPLYDQRRDQQWTQTQQNQQRQQERETWQLQQWQMEQRRRHLRHLGAQSYQVWLWQHGHDYDNRGR
jgi:hypothetical protein